LLLPRCALIKKLQAALEEVAVLKSKRPGERGRRGIYDLARNGRSMIYGFHGFGLLRGATGSGPGCSGSQWIQLETKAAPRIGRNGPSIIGSCPYLGVILLATGLGGWWVSASKSRLSHGYPYQFGVAESRKQEAGLDWLEWLYGRIMLNKAVDATGSLFLFLSGIWDRAAGFICES